MPVEPSSDDLRRDRPGPAAVVSVDRDDWRSRARVTLKRPFAFVSPTWALAEVLKPRRDRKRRARIIRALNLFYLLLSAAGVAVLALATDDDLRAIRPAGFSWEAVALQWVLLWRFLEIGYAFLRDAFDKLQPIESSSDLRWGERVMLAMRSYLELILDFSLIYALFPASVWTDTTTPPRPAHLTDLVWYSANVITTSGGGGYYPASFPLRLLSLLEVFCGVVLLVVSFTIYASHAVGDRDAE